jgi:deoxyadenosine/deoxycytidine kinase
MSLDINMDFQKEKLRKVHSILQDPNRKIIVVDGIIGAGKTTTIKEIETRFNNICNNDNKSDNKSEDKSDNKSEDKSEDNKSENDNIKIKVKAIYEPVDKWKSTGSLEYFYKDIPKNAYAFQTFTYITRISSVIDEIYDCPDADIYILERSIWTDRYIFMELLKDLITNLEMNMYNEWCDMWAYILPLRVDKWVLLNTSLDESLKRIASRNRDGEKSGISVEYQTNLYKKHIEFYEKLVNDKKPVTIIESNIMDENFVGNNDKIDYIIQQILDIDMKDFAVSDGGNEENEENEKKEFNIYEWVMSIF